MVLRADALTAGVKLTNRLFRLRFFTTRGRKVYPRKSNFVFEIGLYDFRPCNRQHASCLGELGRPVVWSACRGNHLGQRSCASARTGRTYGRKRTRFSPPRLDSPHAQKALSESTNFSD